MIISRDHFKKKPMSREDRIKFDRLYEKNRNLLDVAKEKIGKGLLGESESIGICLQSLVNYFGMEGIPGCTFEKADKEKLEGICQDVDYVLSLGEPPLYEKYDLGLNLD